MFADALVRLLAGADGISVAGVVGSLAEAVAMIAERGVDLIVLDVDLPDGQGVAAIHAVRGKAPEAGVILLAGREDEALLSQVIDCVFVAAGWKNVQHRVTICPRGTAPTRGFRGVGPGNTLEAQALLERQQRCVRLGGRGRPGGRCRPCRCR